MKGLKEAPCHQVALDEMVSDKRKQEIGSGDIESLKEILNEDGRGTSERTNRKR